ncbi:hypothetical protein ACF0H5_004505 [Mactra antiquata]
MEVKKVQYVCTTFNNTSDCKNDKQENALEYWNYLEKVLDKIVNWGVQKKESTEIVEEEIMQQYRQPASPDLEQRQYSSSPQPVKQFAGTFIRV